MVLARQEAAPKGGFFSLNVNYQTGHPYSPPLSVVLRMYAPLMIPGNGYQTYAQQSDEEENTLPKAVTG